jgi:hypothetical protein
MKRLDARVRLFRSELFSFQFAERGHAAIRNTGKKSTA